METEEKEICGNCKFSKYDFVTKSVICSCEESECYGIDLFYKDSCSEFEIRLPQSHWL